MKNQILTTDFTPHELVNLKTHYLVAAKKMCSDKITFYQNEINTGHCCESHINNLELYFNEFIKWVPIVNAAKERDRKDENDFWGPYDDSNSYTGLQG